ncbi:TetR/AcrR family transcriptional regulator [Streptomyces lavendulae]|uniref:TetR/AcrR family transcriptional regulator n=1 Tax=Streptomyces lavendulae TaxID=1914 RepID=UPI00369A64D0
MPSATTPRKAPERPSSPSPARERLLAAAGRVFYAEGIHATPVDRVIEEAGVTRATFYRHFPGKESLVLAYVERRDAEVRAAAAEAAETIDTPLDLLHALVAGVAAEICRPGFRGCLFLNAAAEYPDPGNPVRVAVAGHRAWLRELLADVLSRAGHPDPPAGAALLLMLRDGAMAAGYLESPEAARVRLTEAVSTLIREHRPGPGSQPPSGAAQATSRSQK